MKIDVEKFIQLTNDTHYIPKWDKKLHDMMNVIGLPTYSDGKHSFTSHECKKSSGHRIPIDVFFDESGNISASVWTRADPKSKNFTKEDVDGIINEVLRYVSVFGEYGLLKTGEDL